VTEKFIYATENGVQRIKEMDYIHYSLQFNFIFDQYFGQIFTIILDMLLSN